VKPARRTPTSRVPGTPTKRARRDRGVLLTVEEAVRRIADGRMIVVVDDARRENVFGLLMSLNMLIEFGDAFDYSAADFRKWCGEVGFKRFDVIHLAGASSAAIAYK